MKKFFLSTLAFLLMLFCCLFPFGCGEQKEDYTEHLSELRQDVFAGTSESFTLRAHYGFKKTDGNKIYNLTFILKEKASENVNYSVLLSFNGKDYKTDFKLNAISGVPTASIEVNEFNLKEFTVQIVYSSTIEEVCLKSAIPNECKDYSVALNSLKTSQPELLNSYVDENGDFTASISMRVLVKDNKPYYYVGFTDKNDNLKALLLNGTTLEVLAIREIF